MDRRCLPRVGRRSRISSNGARHSPAKDDHVALHPVEHRDAGQFAPALEAEFLEQIQAGLVMPENETDQAVYADGWRMGDGLRQEMGTQAEIAERLADVNAQLGSLVVCRPPVEFRET